MFQLSRVARLTLLGAVFLTACPETRGGEGDAAGEGEVGDPDEGEVEESDGTGGEGALPGELPCEATADCRQGVCAGIWDAGRGEPLRAPTCSPLCIESADPRRVCVDDAGCCEGGSCDASGLCQVSMDDESGDGEGG